MAGSALSLERGTQAEGSGVGGTRRQEGTELETKIGAGDLTEESASEVGVRSRSCWEQVVG